MTVNISIGNAEIEPIEPGYPMSFAVGLVESNTSVPFKLGIWSSNTLDYRNSFWENFCREVGILETFYWVLLDDNRNEKNIELRCNPGVLWLTNDDLEIFRKALSDYQSRYPDTVIRDEITSDTVKIYLHILTWLVYWSERALKEAKRPGIGIS